MVSLCGLALSSLFVINSKSVVHADAVNDANNQNNNAISWDSDSDKAQQVQNDTEQSAVQRADDNQQNVQSVQPSRAETSNAESSSAARPLTNQTKSVQVSNVNDVQKINPIIINNPAGDKVNVHYVNRDGGAITDPNVKDTTIDVTKTGQGSYQVPSGYNLNNPDGKYTISGGAFNGTNIHATVNEVPATRGGYLDSTDFSGRKYGFLPVNFETGQVETSYNINDNSHQHGGTAWAGSEYLGNIRYAKTDAEGNQYYYAPGFDIIGGQCVARYDGRRWGSSDKVDISGLQDGGYIVVDYGDTGITSPAYTTQTLPVAFVDSNNNIVGMMQNYTGEVGTSQNISLSLPTGYKLADGQTMPTSVTFANDTKPLLIKVAPNGQTNSVQNPANNTINVNFVDQETHQSVGTTAIDLTKQQGTNYYQTPNGWATDNDGKYTINNKIHYDHSLTLHVYNASQANANSAFMVLARRRGRKDYSLNWRDVDGSFYKQGNDNQYMVEIDGDDLQLSDDNSASWSIYDKSSQLYKDIYAITGDINSPAEAVLIPYSEKIIDSTAFTDNYHPYDASTNTVTVPVHKTNSFTFSDNSGNVKSVSGNTVDVTLTKPQSVNPATDTRCQASATRVIHVNFPDGQIPESYKGVVDSNGDLKQTVHFTRTATEDALTGNILQYGNWTSDNKDHNFIGFPERTLPRIPGYTLSIKPF